MKFFSQMQRTVWGRYLGNNKKDGRFISPLQSFGILVQQITKFRINKKKSHFGRAEHGQ